MLKALILLALLTTLAFGQGDSIDNGQRLLSQLQVDAEKNLEDVKTFWADTEPLYLRGLQSAQQSVDQVAGLCKSRNQDVEKTQQDIEKTNHFIEWIGQRIHDNTARVELLNNERCAATKNYINGLKNRKITLKLIDFLRKAVLAKDNLQLIQYKEIISKLKVFLQLYTDNHFLKMLQMETGTEKKKQDSLEDYDFDSEMTESQRTAQQVGTGHIDDNRAQISVQDFQSIDRKDWPAYKAQILALLDTLESEIGNNIKQSQDDEIAAGVSLAEFQITIERENQQLDRQLAEQAANLGKFEALLVERQSAQTLCSGELESVTAQLTEAQEQYNSKKEQFVTKKDSIQSEIDTFRMVIALYKTNLVNAGGSDVPAYGAGAGQYASRQVDTFDFMKL